MELATVLLAIAHLCGPISVVLDSASGRNLQCQKEMITCLEEKHKINVKHVGYTSYPEDLLSCIKDRKHD